MAIETTFSAKLHSLLRRCMHNPADEFRQLPSKLLHGLHYLGLHWRRERLIRQLALKTANIPNWALISDVYRVDYLSAHLCIDQRMACLEKHYQHLLDFLPPGFITNLAITPLPVWAQDKAQGRFTVQLSLPLDNSRNEGDLLLTLNADEQAIFQMNCCIVPGALFNAPPKTVLFIGRIQGATHGEQVKQVTRELAHVPPPYFLLAAAQGLAQALCIDQLVGVGATHMCQARDHFSFNYPALWESLDATPCGDFFSLPVPFPERDLSEVSSRSRTLKKRRLKAAVTQSTVDTLHQHFLTKGSSA